MTATVIDRFGRIHVARDAAGPRRYVRRTLLAPRGWRERASLTFGRLSPDDSQLFDMAGKAFAPVRAAVGAVVSKGGTPAWIQIDDYEGSRGRAIVFLFASRDADLPFAVAKVHTGSEGISLRHERDALRTLSATTLRMTVPEVRSYEEQEGTEVLILSAMAGESIYRQMKSAIVPALDVHGHFTAARRWLTEFQRGRERGVHGDFWARNILIGEHGTSVVDWENYDADGDPLTDVFHFALTYATAFRWEARERLDAVEKFRRAFAHGNVVSRAVRSWLAHFAESRRMSQPALKRRMRQWLESGAEGAIARPRLTTGEWASMLEILDGRTQCVFSG